MCETSTTEERRRKEEAEAAGAELKTKTPHNDVGNENTVFTPLRVGLPPTPQVYFGSSHTQRYIYIYIYKDIMVL